MVRRVDVRAGCILPEIAETRCVRAVVREGGLTGIRLETGGRSIPEELAEGALSRTVPALLKSLVTALDSDSAGGGGGRLRMTVSDRFTGPVEAPS